MEAERAMHGALGRGHRTNARWLFQAEVRVPVAPSSDFIAQLERRLKVDGETALALLGEWLVCYERRPDARRLP